MDLKRDIHRLSIGMKNQMKFKKSAMSMLNNITIHIMKAIVTQADELC